MDIMFISSPSNARGPHMPYYFLYLAGFLEKHGIQVTIVNPHFRSYEENISFILEKVKSLKPKYIGLACFVTDYNVIYKLAVTIKKISNAIILIGNAQPSIAPEDFLYKGSPFDIVVRGEGEETVKEIITSPYRLETRDQIDGIAFFDGESVVTTKNRKLMNLSDCGNPAYHLLDMDWYTRPTKYLIRRLVTVCTVIYTGRGCPFECGFCASNTVWHTNDKSPGNSYVRSRPLNVVMEELALLQNKYGYDFFYVLDDTFGIRESDIIAFCDAYKASGLKMQWAAETRVSCIKTPEMVKLLKDSGCIQLDFGVETGSPALLAGVNKKITVDQIIYTFDLCRKYGMRTFANILLNLPQEKEEDLNMTHKLLERIRPTYVSVGLTQPYPGSPIYKSLGLKIDKSDYHLLDRFYPPEQFRLSSHRIPLPELLYSWQRKYTILTLFEKSLFSVGVAYWRKILFSKHSGRYLLYLLKDIMLTPIIFMKNRIYFMKNK